MNALETRLLLKANGFSPIPCEGKRPVVSGWQNRIEVSDEDIDAWQKRRDCPNTGMLAGYAPAFDLDIMQPEAVERCEEIVRNWHEDRGEILVRIGLPPKRLIPFRTDHPFRKMVAHFKAPNGSDHKIEVLGDGQQFIVDGIHPDTHRPYRWHGDRAPWNIKREDLPLITEEDARELLDHLIEALTKHFGYVLTSGPTHKNGQTAGGGIGEAHTGPVDVEAELASMVDGHTVNKAQTRIIPSLLHKGEHPADVQKFVADETMLRIGARLGWTRAEEDRYVAARIVCGYELILRKYDPASGVPYWLPGEFHADWVSELARGRRPSMGHGRGQFYVRRQEQANGRDANREPQGNGRSPEEAADTLLIKSSKEFIAGFVPPDYLIEQLLQRRYFYSCTARTGDGKTAVALTMTAHVALGWQLGGLDVAKGKVLYFAGENPTDVKMRWIAMSERMGFDADTIEVYFIEGASHFKQVAERVRKEVERLGVEFHLIVIDTSAAYFDGDAENDNTQQGENGC
jgi:AAA domain/Bifunctional DNA primase/polymerase, N-terminal